MADENINNDSENSNEIPSELQVELDMRFQLLPPDIQNVIIEAKYAKTLFEIAKANQLTYGNLETLQLETFMVLLGMNKPEEFRIVLKSALKKNDAEMDVIMGAINEQIFDPIKDSMKKIYDVDYDNEADLQKELETTGSIPDQEFFLPKKSVEEDTEDSLPENTQESVSATKFNVNVVKQPQDVSKPAQTISASSGLSSMEKGVLGNAGVVVNESQNNIANAPTAEKNIPDRNDLMKGIENPVKTPTSTIMANKLSVSSTLMPNKTTDYSLPKTTAQSSTTPAAPVVQNAQTAQPVVQTQTTTNATPAKASGDPYREAV